MLPFPRSRRFSAAVCSRVLGVLASFYFADLNLVDFKGGGTAAQSMASKLMKDIGYGSGYTYDHDAQEGFSGDNYWPDEMEPQHYYQPVERGFEREVKKRLGYWEKLRRDRGEV